MLLVTGACTSSQDELKILNPGVYQAEDGRVKKFSEARRVDADGAEYGEVIEAKETVFTFYGTDVFVRWRISPLTKDTNRNDFVPILVEYRYNDRRPKPGVDWQITNIFHSSLARMETIHLGGLDDPMSGYIGTAYEIDSITVVDRTFQNVAPLVAGVLIFVGMLVYVVVSSLRARWAK